MNREAIASSLYQRLVGIDVFRTTGRLVKDWSQVAPSDCPAFFLGVGASDVTSEARHARLWRLEFVAYLYVHDGSQLGPGGQVNDLVDRIDAELRRGATDAVTGGAASATTLGGLVYSARVSRVETDEGSFGDRGVAVVTIEVLAAG